MKFRPLFSLVTVSAVAISILGPANIAVAEGASSNTGETAQAAKDPLPALQAVTADSVSAATEVLANVASVPTDKSGISAIDAVVNDIGVIVPTDPADPVSLQTSNGTSIKISLPFSGDAANAEPVSDGVVAYDNDNGSTTVPVVKGDGSLQIATVIHDSAAPTAYTYSLGLAPNSSLSLEDDGMVTVLGPEGSRVGTFAPAWAKDANGTEVETHYEVSGTTLVQVVDHTTAGIAYPVTADPYLFFDLIESAYWSGQTFVVTPTYWARVNGANSQMHLELFREFCTKYRSVCNTQMWWQLACHAQFAPFKGTWNLDSWRWRDSYYAYIQNLCN